MTGQLGNARLLTMDGDGHTAYGGNSQCIDAAVDGYLEDLALPAPGTVCRQQVEDPAPAAAITGDAARSTATRRAISRLRAGEGALLARARATRLP